MPRGGSGVSFQSFAQGSKKDFHFTPLRTIRASSLGTIRIYQQVKSSINLQSVVNTSILDIVYFKNCYGLAIYTSRCVFVGTSYVTYANKHVSEASSYVSCANKRLSEDISYVTCTQ